MGYILPINNYQAQHYQERVTQIPTDPIPIDRVVPKKIEIGYYRATNNELLNNHYNQNQYQQPRKDHQNQAVISKRADQIISELTGIGRQINYSI
ncbi:hypothetical protein [Amphibacillus indicireducens]|uniref:Uncharacterized protein n=1 Tax=Amphibacillus indicireducens TaxID=1076330 RepID=A0ABP7V1Z8_9BACI